MLGHASIQQTQRYLNVRTKTQERAGSELEQQRPTASLGVGKLIDLVSSTDCPRFVPGDFKNRLRGLATTIICSSGALQLETRRSERIVR
jgi:hypothetical protein